MSLATNLSGPNFTVGRSQSFEAPVPSQSGSLFQEIYSQIHDKIHLDVAEEKVISHNARHHRRIADSRR